MARMGAWPALLAELRAQMEAGVDARVREAFMHEPDLRLGVGMEEALLTLSAESLRGRAPPAARERRTQAERIDGRDSARGASVARKSAGARRPARAHHPRRAPWRGDCRMEAGDSQFHRSLPVVARERR